MWGRRLESGVVYASSQFRSVWSRYGLAVLLVLVAAGLRYALHPLFGTLTPFLFFILAEVAVALLAGRGPGLVAVVVGTLLGYYLFVGPEIRLGEPERIYYLLLNLCMGVALVWMADGMHRSRNQAQQSEAALRASHERMSDLLARIGDPFFSFDLEWKCLYANPRAENLTGKAGPEMKGKTFRELLPGIFTPARAQLLKNAVASQDFLALDGVSEPEGIWFELSAYPGPDTISVFIREVTDRKRAEIAMARSEEQFRRIFNDSPVGMSIVAMNGRFYRVNNAVCRMLEYSPEELLNLSTVDVTPAEDLETSGFYSHKQQALVTGAIDHLQMEKRYLTKSGKIVWTNLNASMLRQSDDTVYFLGIIENITERRQVEEQLRESQKLESLGVLAGGIAHDFNNLLTGILGNASLGLDIAPAGSPMRPLLESLVKASERAADLTRQLLAYAGKGRFVLKAMDLSSAVQEISSLVRASFPGHVHLDLKLANNLTAIEADPAQIQQVIMNLLLNAAESVEPGREGRVTVATSERLTSEGELRSMLSSGNSQPGTYVELEVSDNGSGMDSATQARMFEPFYTTKFTGRGLGLSAVLGIVRSSGGALNVESQPGGGTRIRILLPASAKVPERRPQLEQDLKGSGTVLVVDDEPMVLALARSTLERAGYRVLTANGGAEAEKIFRSRRDEIGVVVLDVTMPEMNGEEAYRRLKALRADVPVVLSSGHSEDETTSRFQGAGLAGFLQKPYSASQLAEKVKSTMQMAVKTC